METIKFRGKDINGKWHYGDLLNMTEKDEETGELIKGCAIVSLGVNETIVEPREGVAVEIYESEIVIVDPRTVGQFTDVTDDISSEIFEGDIITYACQTAIHKAEICYYNGSFCLKTDHGGLILLQRAKSLYRKIRIIGNIHN